jgi:hypothetical protein
MILFPRLSPKATGDIQDLHVFQTSLCAMPACVTQNSTSEQETQTPGLVQVLRRRLAWIVQDLPSAGIEGRPCLALGLGGFNHASGPTFEELCVLTINWVCGPALQASTGQVLHICCGASWKSSPLEQLHTLDSRTSIKRDSSWARCTTVVKFNYSPT